jgi:hypothetical protein
VLTGKVFDIGAKHALIIERIDRLDTVSATDHEVFHAVIGRGMDTTGTGVERNVIAQQNRNIAIVERVGKDLLLQHCAGEVRQDGAFNQAGAREKAF